MADEDKQVSRKRQWISGANAVTVVIAAIAIAFLANAIASQFSRLRIDMTENNLYTLADGSKEVVGNLEEPVQVKAFISANMPKPKHKLRQRVEDLLSEYRAASGGDLSFKIYSPGSDKLTDKESKEIEKDAKGYGCEKVGIGQRGKDKVSLRAVYKCVAFIQQGGQKTEVIKDLKSRGQGGQGNFEYEFTKALMNLTTETSRKVGFVSGFGGPADSRGFERQISPVFENLFGELVKPTTVDLSGEEPSVPEDVSALVLLNPSKEFSDTAKWALDQFLQQGGSIGWYQSATGVDQQMRRKMRRKMGAQARLPQFRKPLEPKLREFFKTYGINLNKDLVLDRSHAMVGMVRTDRGPAMVGYPATFTTTNVDKTLPFTKDFGTIGFPGPSSMDIQASARDNSAIEAYEVVKTHESAVHRSGFQTDMSYKNLRQEQDSEEAGPFVLSAALQGDLPSYFQNKKPPAGVSTDESNSDASASSRLLVVGQGTFFQPNQGMAYKRRLASIGGQFFISSIEWLVQDSALAKIRGKSMPRLIDEVPTGRKRTIQFVNIACVPAFFALIGIVMMYRRRRRRDQLKWPDNE